MPIIPVLDFDQLVARLIREGLWHCNKVRSNERRVTRMGKSYTIHCVGIPTGLAMSRVEMAQEEYKAVHHYGQPIIRWIAQTKVGERILAAPAPKLVQCPICAGAGHNGDFHCPVCNGSGVCKKGNEKHWLPWQLDRMLDRMREAHG